MAAGNWWDLGGDQRQFSFPHPASLVTGHLGAKNTIHLSVSPGEQYPTYGGGMGIKGHGGQYGQGGGWRNYTD